ncbi:MAG: c-type cytochrome [Moorea sp. SIO2B7]|nr:c-type cytochrome [Moorena sp. SIO2B7]
MKKILLAILLILAAINFTFSSPAYAGDIAQGQKVFNVNCYPCHRGGSNVVNPKKNLKKDTLEKYKMYSKGAIIKQVTYGKGAMPRFGGRLSATQIEDVAAYVLSQSEKGW